MKRLGPIALACLLMLPSLTAGARARGTSVASPIATPMSGYSARTLANLDEMLSELLNRSPGAVVYVDSPAGVYQQARGVGNLATSSPMPVDAPFQIGSNTKMMTAAIVLQLWEAGQLSLDDPLSLYLPDVASKLRFGEAITVRMLLNHTSGVYDYFNDFVAADFLAWTQDGGGASMTRAWTPQQIVDYILTYRTDDFAFQPGEPGKWQYTNTGYILLGLIIEKITGRSYAQNLQERIFDPLGMTHTTLGDKSPPASDVASYYQKPYEIETSAFNLSQAWAAGAVISTPPDLAVFLRALLHGKLFQRPETLTAMQTTIGGSSPGAKYALGLINVGDGIWGHGGATLGFQSAAAYDVNRDIVFIAWTNCATAPAGAYAKLLPQLIVP